jgi:hypothetical protein
MKPVPLGCLRPGGSQGRPVDPLEVVETHLLAFGPDLDAFEERAGLVGPGPADRVGVIEVHVGVDERFDDQTAGGVERLGVRADIASAGAGRTRDDGTESPVGYVDVPGALSAPEDGIGYDHSDTSSWHRLLTW